MSLIVYKQRCNPPSRMNTPMLNVNHARYIATRPGAVTNYGEMFGAFGRVGNMRAAGDIDDLYGLLSYVREKSIEKTNMYRSIISMRESDAHEMGIVSRKDWEVMVERQMESVAKHMNIPLSRLEWTASVHMEPGHPHVHLMYWDREQTIKSYFVKPGLVDEIRKDMIKDVFAERFDALYTLRNAASADIKTSLRGMLEDLEQTALDMSDAEIERYRLKFMSAWPGYSTPGILNARSFGTNTDETVKMIRELCASLPKTGRVSYKFMPPEAKAQTEALARHIVANNPQCAAAMQSYMDCSRDIASMYSNKQSNIDKMSGLAEGRIIRELCNSVLNAAKEINTISRYEQQSEAALQAIQRQTMFEIINAAFTMLSRYESRQHFQRELSRQELSEQARREMALRRQITGLDWGQDR